MLGYLSLGLVALYFIIGLTLELRAWRAFRPGAKWWWNAVPLDDPKLFTEEGLRRRRVALWFYGCGGIVLVLLLALITWL